jgi:hypothetical protein
VHAYEVTTSYNKIDPTVATLLGNDRTFRSSVSTVGHLSAFRGKTSVPYFVGVLNPIKSTQLL